MADFFTPGSSHEPALVLFLNSGDPPLDELEETVLMLDEEGVGCLELAVPFPDSITDGPVVRRSARRALDRGVDLDDVLGFVGRVRPGLQHLRIAVLVDWSHSLKHRRLSTAVGDVAASGADALLTHALPPRLNEEYYAAVHEARMPVVTTCYPQTPRETAVAAGARATAFLYLVARYGRSGTGPSGGHAELAPTVARLRTLTEAPIAIGFGVRTGEDVAAVGAAGADAAIVGSAGVARIETAREEGGDATAALRGLVRSCRAS
ncbi:tryptophan synthase subunit alpha [Nocardiopsis salina]|uniref:tryptophan synthase subunit alpha n=1 Tax=Nocardiopsis salina TaxID=245836 RepID=UPI00036128C4|nr:tryptophan synthase subunit alpha [Nocardiopsis salina]